MYKKLIFFCLLINLISFNTFTSASTVGEALLSPFKLVATVLTNCRELVAPKPVLDDENGDILRNAILNKNSELIKVLARKYNIDLFNTIQERQSKTREITYRFDTPLRLALYSADKDIFALVLKSMNDPNARFRTFPHILNNAVQLRNIEVVKILLEAKIIDINGDSKELGPEHFSPISDALSIQDKLYYEQVILSQKMETGSDEQKANKQERFKQISNELNKTREIIHLLSVAGAQPYTPRTNNRLIAEKNALIPKKQE